MGVTVGSRGGVPLPCNAPTCTGAVVLNGDQLSPVTSSLLQLALVAVVFPVGTANLQKTTAKCH